MALITKQVEVKWHGNNRKHYEALGYVYTKQGDAFKVKVEDLPSGSNVRVKIKCDYCRKKYNPTWKGFLTGRRRAGELKKDACGDGVCRAMKRAEIKQGYYTTVADVPELLEEWNDDEDPSGVLANSNEKYSWKCKTCSGEWKATPNDRTNLGNGCPHCANHFRYSEPLSVTHPELLEEWSDKNELRPNEVTAGSAKTIIWECKTCSGEWKATPNSRTHGRGCPSCNESKGEKLVASILDNLNVCYLREYKYPTLKGMNGGNLRFDFSIIKNGKISGLIEYDGVFHYRSVYENDGHERTVKHDAIKNNFSNSYSIPLLRLDYRKSLDEIERDVYNFINGLRAFDEFVINGKLSEVNEY